MRSNNMLAIGTMLLLKLLGNKSPDTLSNIAQGIQLSNIITTIAKIISIIMRISDRRSL